MYGTNLLDGKLFLTMEMVELTPIGCIIGTIPNQFNDI
jgi:hypothetical protein